MNLMDEIKALCELGRDYNLKKIKLDNVEIEFSGKIDTVPRDLGIEAVRMPTDDEMLFASSIPMTEDEVKAQPPTEP